MLTAAGDTRIIRTALDAVQPGEVLVINGFGDGTRALIGDLIAERALSLGVAGVVIDGCLSDVDAIREIGIAGLSTWWRPAGVATIFLPARSCETMSRVTTFTIDGAAVRDIPSFYEEINRVFMAGETWRLGDSLDALNDLLYGGFGALAGQPGVRVVWQQHKIAEVALGREATLAHYRDKLQHPDVYSVAHFRGLIDDFENGAGQTYFDIVLEIFADHPEIELVLA